jgi:6,7-dimethyl-8-ribityllumazine synthase
MPKELEGHLQAAGLRLAIVVSRFNELVTDRLLQGALDAIRRHGGDLDSVTVVRVPGAWELPVTSKTLASTSKFDAIIGLGAVVQGETPHFEYVAGQAASGLATVALETGVPVIFGVLTTSTMEQALDRAGAKAGNKGYDAAVSSIEMANLLKMIRTL